ncbi:acid-binding homolog 5-like [Octopus vulgaris]|nr:acid-binding homolog 5-like [Octopus vulgaris]
MTDLCGHWKLEKNENMDEYMQAVGVGFALRKIVSKLSSYTNIQVDESGTWTLDITSTFKNIHLQFKLGEEFDETTGDGRHMKSTFTVEDGALKQIQRATKSGGVDSIIIRKLQEDGTMIATLEAVDKNVIGTRSFVRHEKS